MLVDVLVWQASGMKDEVGVGHTGKIRVSPQKESLCSKIMTFVCVFMIFKIFRFFQTSKTLPM